MSVTKFKPPDSCTSNENGPECRICLAQLGVDERVYNLFDTWCPPWDGMESTIAEDLNLLTNIQVNKEDILSNTICRSCKERLQNACDFVKFAQKNDLMLKRANSLQPESESMWPKPIELEKNIEGHILENSMVMEIDIKQEVDSEEDEYSISGMEGGSTDLNAEIKVEPEEMVLPDITPAVQINGTLVECSFTRMFIFEAWLNTAGRPSERCMKVFQFLVTSIPDVKNVDCDKLKTVVTNICRRLSALWKQTTRSKERLIGKHRDWLNEVVTCELQQSGMYYSEHKVILGKDYV